MEDLRTLGKLITDSIQLIDDSCTRRGVTFPKLEDPTTGLNDSAYDDLEVKQAVTNIVAAAAHITAIVRLPSDTLQSHGLKNHVSSAMGVLVRGHIVEILKPYGREGLHIDEIARQSDIDKNKLARILRLLATEHILTEVKSDVFALNRVSVTIDTGKSIDEIRAKPDEKYIGSSGTAAILDHITHHSQKSSAYISETLLDPKTAHSTEAGATPFNRSFQTDLTFWEWLELPENKHELRLFSMAMRGASKLFPSDAILKGFDFDTLPSGSVVVDVAGGVGSQTMILARAHPQLKYVIQDRAALAGEMQEFWKAEYADGLTGGKVSFQAIDIFSEQPIKDASVFFMRMILHDWSDTKCITILKHLRAAAQPSTKLLILEVLLAYAVPSASSDAKGLEAATTPPAPLLLNAGHGGVLPHFYDLTMMIGMNGAQERTLDHFNALLAASGWKIESVHKQPYYVNGHSQIVAVPV
ncbi:hypothetical protein EIP91_000504 [Steccherinum ochraceum]|uniref:O-methyltransferase C-terminal domain-containing protein n=1 Tax=Steccherinum ochraceum TaxID=92696 RepID=A0A4R0RSY5_9APHY|nr:hypothetical protein EIP91_000504 [Steccherinum ochraceum]